LILSIKEFPSRGIWRRDQDEIVAWLAFVDILGASIFQIDCPHLIDSIDEHQRMRRVYRNPKWAMKFVPLTFTELIMALLLVSGQAVAQEPIREKTESVPEQKASSPTSSDATVQAAATGPTTSGMILVSKRSVWAAGESIFLCLRYLWISGWSSVSGNRSGGGLCTPPGREERRDRLDRWDRALAVAERANGLGGT
jgi:hypothetical protein